MSAPFGNTSSEPIFQTPGVGTNSTPFLEAHDLGSNFIIGTSFFPPVGATTPFNGAAPVVIGGTNYAVGYINGQRIFIAQGSTALENAYTANATTYIYADDLGNLYYEATQSGPSGSVYLGSVTMGASAVASVSIAIPQAIPLVIGPLQQAPESQNQTRFLEAGDLVSPFTFNNSFITPTGTSLTGTMAAAHATESGTLWAVAYVGTNNNPLQRVAIPAGDSRLTYTYPASSTIYDYLDGSGVITHVANSSTPPVSSYPISLIQTVTTSASAITGVAQNLYSNFDFLSAINQLGCSYLLASGGSGAIAATFQKPITTSGVGITNLSGALAAGAAFSYTNPANSYTKDIYVAVNFGSGGSLTTALNGVNWPISDAEPATSIAGVVRVIMRRVPAGATFTATPNSAATIESVDYNYA